MNFELLEAIEKALPHILKYSIIFQKPHEIML